MHVLNHSLLSGNETAKDIYYFVDYKLYLKRYLRTPHLQHQHYIKIYVIDFVQVDIKYKLN
jgi:hypothetical protein